MCHFAPPVIDSALTHPFSIGAWQAGQAPLSSKLTPRSETIWFSSLYRVAWLEDERSSVSLWLSLGETPGWTKEARHRRFNERLRPALGSRRLRLAPKSRRLWPRLAKVGAFPRELAVPFVNQFACEVPRREGSEPARSACSGVSSWEGGGPSPTDLRVQSGSASQHLFLYCVSRR